MTWTIDATSGALAHSGTTREVWQVGTTLPATYEVRAQGNDPADNIKVVVRCSGDGRSCFECGIEGTNVVIRKIAYGVVGANLASSAHGLSANETYTLRVRGTGSEIECAVVKSSGAVVSVTYDSTDYQLYRHWGVATDENNAAVQYLISAERTAVTATVSDVLVVISGGDLWASYDGLSIQLVATRVMPSTGPVSMDSLDGKVYIVGGGRARIFDPVAREVDDWVPTAGTLPGGTADGITKATIVRQYRGRLVLGGMDDEPNNLYFSAVGEPLNWDTGEATFGAAVALGVGRNVTVGEPVVALGVLSNNSLMVGCTNSVYVLTGDVGDTAGELIPVALTTGCSGRNAVTQAEEGANIVHSPEGLFLVSGAGVVPVSRDVLTESIQFERTARDNYNVTLCRDPARHGLHVFIDTGSTSAVHFWYDELTGRYAAGAGGFFPETYPVRPTCAVIWRGRPVIGTADGRIVEFSSSATADIGTAIDSYVHLQQIDAPGVENDVMLTRLALWLAPDGDQVSVEVFGAATPQELYDSSTRRTLVGATEYPPRGVAMCPRVRAPALSVRLRNTATGRRWAFETADVHFEVGRRISRLGWQAAATPGTSCTPGTNTTTTTPPPPPPPPDSEPEVTPPGPPPPPPPPSPETQAGGGIYMP